jgi:hypothetical protein
VRVNFSKVGQEMTCLEPTVVFRIAVSSTIKTDCHYITEILLKVALNTINFNPEPNPA